MMLRMKRAKNLCFFRIFRSLILHVIYLERPQKLEKVKERTAFSKNFFSTPIKWIEIKFLVNVVEGNFYFKITQKREFNKLLILIVKCCFSQTTVSDM